MKPCPICDTRGPWGSVGERAAHIRSHHETTCPDCDATVAQSGLAAHQRIFHSAPDVAPVELAAVPDEPATPAPAGEPTPLVCPTCAAGPFATPKGYKSHVSSHETVECPECGRPCAGPIGLGKHRQLKHGVVSASAAQRRGERERGSARRESAAAREPRPSAKRVKALADAIGALMPGSPLVERLAAFVAKNEPDETLWIVITASAGPWLCRVGQLGLLAQREREAVLAVAVAEVYAHIGQEVA